MQYSLKVWFPSYQKQIESLAAATIGNLNFQMRYELQCHETSIGSNIYVLTAGDSDRYSASYTALRMAKELQDAGAMRVVVVTEEVVFDREAELAAEQEWGF